MTIGFSDVFGGGGGAPKVWASGMTVAKWEAVISPLDGEVYRRKTATGSGTTDPADDLTNYIALSFRRTASVNTPAASVFRNTYTGAIYTANGSVKTTLGSISAGVRTLALNLSGRGVLTFAAAISAVGGAGNVRFELIVDGRSVLDVSPNLSSAVDTFLALGSLVSAADGSTQIPIGAAVADSFGVEFRRSCAIYVTPASSWSGGVIAYMYRGNAA